MCSCAACLATASVEPPGFCPWRLLSCNDPLMQSPPSAASSCMRIGHNQHLCMCACCCRHRFMFLWLSALPWSMWPDAHWMVVPITAVVSYLLLGIGEAHRGWLWLRLWDRRAQASSVERQYAASAQCLCSATCGIIYQNLPAASAHQVSWAQRTVLELPTPFLSYSPLHFPRAVLRRRDRCRDRGALWRAAA